MTSRRPSPTARGQPARAPQATPVSSTTSSTTSHEPRNKRPETPPRHHRQTHSTRASSAARLLVIGAIAGALLADAPAPARALRFEPDTNAYSGLTFTFDPRLDKRVEWLHFEHWLAIMQHSSALLHESLNGRAHLGEVRVLIPYKWRASEWPVLHKPGVPIIANRRLRYADSDVLVGFEDPVYKETPFAVQHDECAHQGLHIRMPISFLEHQTAGAASLDPRLKARQLVREFASHRYGVFKESGFRGDFMYPPFAVLPGGASLRRAAAAAANRTVWGSLAEPAAGSAALNASSAPAVEVRGFDEHWNECAFEAQPASGLPTPQAATCAPYLARPQQPTPGAHNQPASSSFNIMSSDPFALVELRPARLGSGQPLEWRDIADSARFHFCGQNFAPAAASPAPAPSSPSGGPPQTSGAEQHAAGPSQAPSGGAGSAAPSAAPRAPVSFAHNQLASNKQNVMCNERSALDVIRSSEDFGRAPFRFLQELPPRLVVCVEYAAHLYQARRLDHGLLEAALAKFLAYDLMADSEMALVLFGQHQSSRQAFKRLDSSTDARLALFSPPIDPFDEPARFYTEQELLALEVQPASAQSAKIVKGGCSFVRAWSEALALAQDRSQYNDLGADVLMITSGLFVEDEAKIEELLRASFKADTMQLQLIIYPSSMLFDTKSRDGFALLDALESEAIVRARIAKLQLIQRVTGAQLHLVREHLDANGDVKMSTIAQFYQIFDHLAKGHSWDQTHSMAVLGQQSVETRPLTGAASRHNHANHANNSSNSNSQTAGSGGLLSRLAFQFELDASVQHELIVGFLDQRQASHSHAAGGKRFALRNLQLRAPNGRLVLTDQHPWPGGSSASLADELLGGNQLLQDEQALNGGQQADEPAAKVTGPTSLESALFPYRAQLKLAGFHLRHSHLVQLNSSLGGRLAGTWTLSAHSDEPLQTSGVAMARVNPAGDTITARCWIQTYADAGAHETWGGGEPAPRRGASLGAASPSWSGGPLRAVKVFVETRAGAQAGPLQELQGRMEVQDELGNIVQNVNMLDDGLGVPDMTRGDGLLSQYVRRAHRPGFYRVLVELSGASGRARAAPTSAPGAGSPGSGGPPASGQDNVCCGSAVPAPPSGQAPDTRHLARQLYCGTFYADAQNRLASQQPPRVTNLTVAALDQDGRRVTLRWHEPAIDISISAQVGLQGGAPSSELDTPRAAALRAAGELESDAPDSASSSSSADQLGLEPESPASNFELLSGQASQSAPASSPAAARAPHSTSGRGVVSSGQQRLAAPVEPAASALANRYEIKLFSDRDAIKRAFEGRHEVGYRFNEWNVDGSFPNASAYGGLKEVTLRVPPGREGIYYIALKVYNNMGVGSHMSNIVQFWLRNNSTSGSASGPFSPELESVYDGQLMGPNGELLAGRGGSLGLWRSSGLDGLSLLILVCVGAFLVSLVCISLVACLAGSSRRSLKTKAQQGPHQQHHHQRGAQSQHEQCSGAKRAIMAAASSSGCGSTSGCGSSQQSEVASSTGGSQDCADEMLNKFALSLEDPSTLAANANGVGGHYNAGLQLYGSHAQQAAKADYAGHLELAGHSMSQQQQQQHHHHHQQHQYHHQQLNQSQNQSQNQPTPWLQHTMINGYAYATVNNNNSNHHAMYQQQQQQQQQPQLQEQANLSPVQSWPADILLSHYDKVKQARERNEAPPVMRFESIDAREALGSLAEPSSASHLQQQQQQQQPHYQPPVFGSAAPRAQKQHQLHQQLHQQLSSVLASKRATSSALDPGSRSTPALDGVAEDEGLVGPPPPPHYASGGFAGAPDDATGALMGAAQHHHAGALMTEPTIYSQVTNLHQVSQTTSVSNDLGGYYANQSQVWGAFCADPAQQHPQPQAAHEGQFLAAHAMGAEPALQAPESSTISEV